MPDCEPQGEGILLMCAIGNRQSGTSGAHGGRWGWIESAPMRTRRDVITPDLQKSAEINLICGAAAKRRCGQDPPTMGFSNMSPLVGFTDGRAGPGATEQGHGHDGITRWQAALPLHVHIPAYAGR